MTVRDESEVWVASQVEPDSRASSRRKKAFIGCGAGLDEAVRDKREETRRERYRKGDKGRLRDDKRRSREGCEGKAVMNEGGFWVWVERDGLGRETKRRVKSRAESSLGDGRRGKEQVTQSCQSRYLLEVSVGPDGQSRRHHAASRRRTGPDPSGASQVSTRLAGIPDETGGGLGWTWTVVVGWPAMGLG